MIFRSNVKNRTDVNLEWKSTANFLFQLRLILKGEITNVNIILQSEGELAVGKYSVFG